MKLVHFNQHQRYAKHYSLLIGVWQKIFELLWLGVVEWSKWFQELGIWHFKITVVTITSCEMLENVLWGTEESNLIVFVTSVCLCDRWFTLAFISLLVILGHHVCKTHHWQHQVNKLPTIWLVGFLLLILRNSCDPCELSVHYWWLGCKKSLLWDHELGFGHESTRCDESTLQHVFEISF